MAQGRASGHLGPRGGEIHWQEDASGLRSLTLKVRLPPNGRVQATLVVHHSDQGDEPLSGTYRKHRYGDYVSESMIVSNDWTFVALTRTSRPK